MYFIIREGEIYAGPFDSMKEARGVEGCQNGDKIVSSDSGRCMFLVSTNGSWEKIRRLVYVSGALVSHMKWCVQKHIEEGTAHMSTEERVLHFIDSVAAKTQSEEVRNMYFIIREGEIHAGPFDSADQCATNEDHVFDKVVRFPSGRVMFERAVCGWFETSPCYIEGSLLEEMRSHVLAYEKANAISQRNDADQLAQEFIDAADMVNVPPHYTQAGIECIDAIAAATSGKTGIEAVCVANVIKYLWRYELKNGVEDVRKARWYLDRLIGELEK